VHGTGRAARLTGMEINLPDVHAELSAVFEVYERALVGNDLATLDALFWSSDCTVRYGSGENLYGIDAIRAFRAARSPLGLARTLRNSLVTTYGRDFGTTMTEFLRPGFAPNRIGRQSQTWLRTAAASHGGWRVVAAHVSIIELPEPGSADTGADTK